tara:strand:+ start:186 stop:380 length:195 start_codon:yes stop_codon:yes gene_type:complete
MMSRLDNSPNGRKNTSKGFTDQLNKVLSYDQKVQPTNDFHIPQPFTKVQPFVKNQDLIIKTTTQ